MTQTLAPRPATVRIARPSGRNRTRVLSTFGGKVYVVYVLVAIPVGTGGRSRSQSIVTPIGSTSPGDVPRLSWAHSSLAMKLLPYTASRPPPPVSDTTAPTDFDWLTCLSAGLLRIAAII